MEQTASKKKGIILTLLGGVCWGISGCFGQYLFQEKGATAEWLVSIRLLSAGILLVILGYMNTGKKMNAVFHNKKDLKDLLIFSFLGMLFCQYTYFAAVSYSNAGTATVLQSLAPTIILIYVCVRQLRLPKGYELLAIAMALLGIFLLSTHGNIHSMQLTNQALLFGLLSALGATFYNLLVGNVMRKYGVYVVVGYSMLFAGIALSLIARPWKNGIPFDTMTIVCLVGVVVIGTAIAFSLYLKGVSILGAFMGSLLGATEPVTAIVVSALFLGSVFHWLDIVGFIFILSTVMLLSFCSMKQSQAEVKDTTSEPIESGKE